MTTIDRRVQRLRVRAPNDADAQRATILVEDALRTATIAGEMPARVVVIRKLDVGVIAPAASSASVALVVEAAVQRMASSAVRGDAANAATAPMVYFDDDAEVVISLAQRVASGRPATEWFWPLLVPGWTASQPTDRAARVLVERAMATSGGVVAAAHVVDALAATSVIDRLLDSLSESDGRALLTAIGWQEGAAVQPAMRPLAPQLATRSHELMERWVDRWGGGGRDPRALWLAAMLLVADRPARSMNASLPAVVRSWIESAVARPSSGHGVEGEDAHERRGDRDGLVANARPWLRSDPRSPVDSVFGGGPPAPFTRRSPQPSPTSATSPRDDDANREQPHDLAVGPPIWRNPRPTECAGLLFLIPLLTRVGIGSLVAETPDLVDRDWPAALLMRIAHRLGVPSDDPAIAWSATRPAPIAAVDRGITATVIRGARRRARLDTGRAMRAMISRSGAIVATRTHIDVLLRFSQVDVAVRRAGLDLDPGWVPWLGRVVQFHYMESFDVDA